MRRLRVRVVAVAIGSALCVRAAQRGLLRPAAIVGKISPRRGVATTEGMRSCAVLAGQAGAVLVRGALMNFQVRTGRRLVAWAGLCVLSLMIALAPAGAADVPLEVYGRLPDLEDVALSPGGTRLAFVTVVGDQRIVTIVTVTPRKVVRALRLGDTKLRSLRWADP